MAYNVSYNSTLPNFSSNSIGYSQIYTGSFSGTGAGTNVSQSFSFPPGIWLVTAYVGAQAKNTTQNIFAISLSNSSSYDYSFQVNSYFTNLTTGTTMNLSITRVITLNNNVTSFTLFFNGGTPGANTNPSYTVQTTRLA